MSSESALPPRDEPLAAGNARALTAIAMLGIATVLIKLVALAKDWLVAERFGAGDELDAFLIAFMIPSYGVAVLGHSFASAFVPSYLRVYEQQSPATARRLVGSVLSAGVAMLVIVCLLLALAAPLLLRLVGSSFDEAKLALACRLFYLLLGVLAVGGISSILGAVLNAHERFVATALAPLAVPLGTLLGLVLWQQRCGIEALAWGTLAGFAVECCVLFAATARVGLLPRPAWPGIDPALRDVGRRYWPMVIGTLLLSTSAVVDQSMAASLGSGNVSVLNYGGKLVALALSIVAVSLSTVLLPRFSRLIAAGRWEDLDRTIRGYVKMILVGSVPIVAVLALAAEPMIRLLFERGAFTAETTAAVSQVQLYLALQIPFYVLAMLGSRLLSALDSNQTVLRIGALSLVLNIAADYALMQWFGVDGIAMATALVYAVTSVVMAAAIRAKMAEARAAA
ncbi:MAG: murein biosynthesis integral membrane protein MurJ [Pirellulales bacterium]